jgi:hypothetical protein
MSKVYKWFKFIAEANDYINKLESPVLFLSKDISVKQHKKYLVCKYEEFYETLEGFYSGDVYIRPIEDKHRLYHCMIRKNTPIKLFMDIESPFVHNDFLKETSYIDNYFRYGLIKFMCQLLAETNNIKVDHEKDFVYLTATSDKKFSYHIHCTNEKVCFNDNVSLYHFVNYCFHAYNKEMEEYGDFFFYTTREKQEKNKSNPTFSKKEIVDLGVYNGTSIRTYGSSKMDCLSEKNRRFFEYDINKHERNYKFDIALLKKTMIHDVKIDFDDMITFRGLDIKNQLSVVKNSIIEKREEILDLDYFSNFFLDTINDIVKELCTKFNKKVETINRLGTAKILYETNIVLPVNSKCLISRLLFDKDHHNTSGYRFMINIKNFKVHPACFNSSCKDSEIEKMIRSKLTTTLGVDQKEKILVILDKSLTMEEKIHKIREYDTKGKELNKFISNHSKSFDDFF